MIKNKSKFAPKNPERGREDLKRVAITLMTDFLTAPVEAKRFSLKQF